MKNIQAISVLAFMSLCVSPTFVNAQPLPPGREARRALDEIFQLKNLRTFISPKGISESSSSPQNKLDLYEATVQAIQAFLSDAEDSESPLEFAIEGVCVVADEEGTDASLIEDCRRYDGEASNLSEALKLKASKGVLRLMNEKGSVLALLSSENPDPNNTIDLPMPGFWIFTLTYTHDDHTFYVMIDGSGTQKAEVWGFN